MTDLSSDLQRGEPDSTGDPRERIGLDDPVMRRKERIYDTLIDLVTEMDDLSPTDIKPETEIVHDLGLDSLQVYELVIDLESRFEIRISDDELERVNTVQDVVDLIYGMTSE
ncbi:MAG: acyl carrier protein [Clostridiaceae bacterium]|jgi:acyl carrier protein|nr:acyl carrier protein [Oscillospiraceae bacterium]NLO62468.1 acyl carrier protein [Clostridiaceae bacterium]